MRLIIIKNANQILKLKKYWDKFRKRFIPVRLRNSFNIFYDDDRTIIEKIADKIDKFFYDLKKTNQVINARKQVWNTYFDPSLGVEISSYADIKKLEKTKGLTYTTYKEMEATAKQVRDRRAKETKEKTAKYYRETFRDIKKGRSIIREQIQQGLRPKSHEQYIGK